MKVEANETLPTFTGSACAILSIWTIAAAEALPNCYNRFDRRISRVLHTVMKSYVEYYPGL